MEQLRQAYSGIERRKLQQKGMFDRAIDGILGSRVYDQRAALQQPTAEPVAWLEEQEFYEVCQQYRHAPDLENPRDDRMVAVKAFEFLKDYIRAHIAAPPALQGDKDDKPE